MQIDFFTFGVQILNFLILLFILNKLVYKPVIKAMKDRNKQIQDKIEDAENKLKEAEEIKLKYQEELKSIENYKEEEKNKINMELDNYKANEITQLKEDIENKKEDFKKQLENEKDIIIESLIRKFCYEVDGFLVNIFSSISDSSLNNMILNRFLQDIKNSSDINKLKNIKNIDFISSYDITNEEKSLVKNVFRMIGVDVNNINFIRDENLILGNKIKADGVVINSNIKNIINNFTIKLKSTI